LAYDNKTKEVFMQKVENVVFPCSQKMARMVAR